MKRASLLIATGLMVACVVSILTADRASAYGEFKKEFVKKYIHEDSSAANDAALAAAAKKANCNVCHKGKDRKNRNAYGDALNKYITKKDRKKPEKIQGALDKVEADPSDPGKPGSPSFGQLIKEGKLPAGDTH